MAKLKKGYTTGTCAAVAAKAAAKMIFEKNFIKTESLVVPAGKFINIEILDCNIFENSAYCAVKKYSGDDPDVTNNILIYSEVSLTEQKGIVIDGGKGVGRVTKNGLEQPVGFAAINSVPRKMIEVEVGHILEYYGWKNGAKVIVSVPEGEKIAKKTFNPKLGIIGGISILGTSGIVEPMSEKALIDTIKLEMNVKKAGGFEYIVIAPGNYGIDFIKKNLNINIDNAVKCGNFIGESIDYARSLDFKGILLIGHIGKFIKLAGGIMNTHSKNSDCRMEIITANTALCGRYDLLSPIMQCVSTDEAVKILIDGGDGVCQDVINLIMEKIDFYVKKRCDSDIMCGVIMFSNVYGILGKTSDADILISRL